MSYYMVKEITVQSQYGPEDKIALVVDTNTGEVVAQFLNQPWRAYDRAAELNNRGLKGGD